MDQEKFKEFLELVEKMRNKQKEYFKTRDNKVLIEAKQIEGQVDNFIFNLKQLLK